MTDDFPVVTNNFPVMITQKFSNTCKLLGFFARKTFLSKEFHNLLLGFGFVGTQKHKNSAITSSGLYHGSQKMPGFCR